MILTLFVQFLSNIARHNKSADESASLLRSLVASLELLVSGQPKSTNPSGKEKHHIILFFFHFFYSIF